jgi:hypothetical protein
VAYALEVGNDFHNSTESRKVFDEVLKFFVMKSSADLSNFVSLLSVVALNALD